MPSSGKSPVSTDPTVIFFAKSMVPSGKIIFFLTGFCCQQKYRVALPLSQKLLTFALGFVGSGFGVEFQEFYDFARDIDTRGFFYAFESW